MVVRHPGMDSLGSAMLRSAALVWLVGCGAVPEGRPPGLESGSSAHDRRVVQAFEVGAYPVSVVIVRHASPTAIDAVRLQELLTAWLDALGQHQAPWRLGVLPVGADPTTTVVGELLPTGSGERWLDADTLDLGYELTAMQRPMPNAQVENPALDTLLAFDLGSIALTDGIVVMAVVSERDDSAVMAMPSDVASQLVDRAAELALVDLNLDVFTTRSGSACGSEPVAVALGGLGHQAGGYELDICDPTAADRVVQGYAADLDPRELGLDHEPQLETLDLRIDHPDAPSTWVEGRDYTWDGVTNTIQLGWTPPIRARASVSYEPR